MGKRSGMLSWLQVRMTFTNVLGGYMNRDISTILEQFDQRMAKKRKEEESEEAEKERKKSFQYSKRDVEDGVEG